LVKVASYYGVGRLEDMCKKLTHGYLAVRDSSLAKVHCRLDRRVNVANHIVTWLEQDFRVLLEEPVLYSDVAFVVEGETIKAHKVFLAASSVYFKGMFTSGLREAQQDEIELPHIRADVFRYRHHKPVALCICPCA
jgi:hypothetical protein